MCIILFNTHYIHTLHNHGKKTMTCDIVAIITIAKTVSGSIMNIMKSVVKGQIRSVNKSKSGWTMYTIVEKCMKCTCASVFGMHA